MTTKRLLIIEDEIIIGLAFSKYLKAKNYICDLALDYNQAIDLLSKHYYDIALLDIKLKGEKTGLDVAKVINAQYHIPFVFITSYMDIDTLNKAKTLKPKGYLTKPVNKESLYTTLEMIELNHSHPETYLTIKDGKDILRIKKENIQFIQSNHVYVSIHTINNEKPDLIRNSLQNILSLLNSSDFMQVHRCFIANLNKINKINRTELYIDSHRIPIGKTRQKGIAKHIINKHLLK